MNDSKEFLALQASGPVSIGAFKYPHPVNAAILEQYNKLSQDDSLKRTHFFMGRFENTYISEQQIPAITPVIQLARHYAAQILQEDIEKMKMGFWFNEMHPGHETSLHTHEEYDERLSAVYYIQADSHSGDLIVHQDNEQFKFTPEAGKIILFAPEVPHQVEKNNSDILRLSVALNFGY